MSKKTNDGGISNVYMHLIDGKPCFWSETDKSLYFARDGVRRIDMFRKSLDQIRSEQRQDSDRRHGEGLSNYGTYGYLRVRIGNYGYRGEL